ncbi:MAG TPA: VWA domain-containing protein [Spirochaetia bacterium]|nr:VWA domain-containing protein [Spirochaetia bacterium]
MSFIWGRMLWLLFLVPILVAAYVLAQRRRQRYALRYASLSLVKDALGKGPGIRRHIPAGLFLAGLAVIIFALARPSATVDLPSEEGTVILSMDVSGSMRATDIKPSRMEAVKEAARIFINKRPRNVRIGIVAFSGTAELIQPPTTDNDQLVAAVNRLHPERYTAIGSGLQAALDAIFEKADQPQSPSDTPPPDPNNPLTAAPPDQEPQPVPPGSYKSAVIVLMSDGQSNQGPDPLDIADKAANLGVRVFTVGVGTKEGAIIGFEGFSFRVILDEATLKSIAGKTAGTYFKASSEGDLHRIYENLSTRLMVEREKTEITALFVAAAAALLVLAGAFSLLWFNRLP